MLPELTMFSSTTFNCIANNNTKTILFQQHASCLSSLNKHLQGGLTCNSKVMDSSTTGTTGYVGVSFGKKVLNSRLEGVKPRKALRYFYIKKKTH